MQKIIIQRGKKKPKEFYFTENASNGQVVTTSEMYTTKRAAYNGAESVIKNAATAELIDRT